MRRDTPFDGEAAEAADITRQFWGDSRAWDARDHSHLDIGDDPTPTSVARALTGSFAIFRPKTVSRRRGQPMDRTREHGIVRPPAAYEHETFDSGRDATIGELAQGAPTRSAAVAPRRRQSPPPRAPHRAAVDPMLDADEFWGDWAPTDPDIAPVDVEPRQRRGGIDPLFTRTGMILAPLLLLVPFALGLGGGDDTVAVRPDATAITFTAAAPTTGPATAPIAAPEPTAAPGPTAAPTAVDAVAETAAAEPAEVRNQSSGVSASRSRTTTPTASSRPATGAVSATTVLTDSCDQEYTAGPGDSWYRIADQAGISPERVLSLNDATIETFLYPGDAVCLPAEAKMPTPPTTTVAPATTVPATSATTASTTTATTAAPTTTNAPTTTAPATTTTQAPPASSKLSAEQVKALIREIWPDELEEKALAVAYRESGYNPLADNSFCCHGVFQIYYTVHANWLDDYGINSVNDLYDARKNITAAYAIYQRAGGWGPWGG